MSSRGGGSSTPPRFRVAAWALWDCGATGVNAVVITFVFSIYLTEHVGSGLPRSEHARKLAGSSAGDRRAMRRVIGAGDRCLGERAEPFGGKFTINATAVFDYPTIGGLAEYLVSQLPDAASEPSEAESVVVPEPKD